MAGLPSNVAWVSLDQQTPNNVKGTPVTAPTLKLALANAGGHRPRNETAQLNETDSSRDEGETYKVVGGVEGSPMVYARDSYAHKILEAVLGTKSSSVGPTNFTHTLTPANALKYYTQHFHLGGLLYERYEDTMVNEFTARSEAGGPLTFEYSSLGRLVTRLTTDPAAGVNVSGGPNTVYNMNESSVSITGLGGSTALVRSMELTYNNSVVLQQTDDYTPTDVYVGKRTLTLGFDMYFENLDAYNLFHYGSTSGTTQTASGLPQPIFTTAINFTFSKGVNNSIAFDLPRVTIEEVPLQGDPGGDPIIVSVRGRAVRGVGASPTPILTATVKNQVAT